MHGRHILATRAHAAMRCVGDHQVTANEARCECARGLRPLAGHGFGGAHHVLACPLALTLITERNRLVDGNPRADPPLCAEVCLTPINMLATQIRIFWRPSRTV